MKFQRAFLERWEPQIWVSGEDDEDASSYWVAWVLPLRFCSNITLPLKQHPVLIPIRGIHGYLEPLQGMTAYGVHRRIVFIVCFV